jgi:hypothetical protein
VRLPDRVGCPARGCAAGRVRFDGCDRTEDASDTVAAVRSGPGRGVQPERKLCCASQFRQVGFVVERLARREILIDCRYPGRSRSSAPVTQIVCRLARLHREGSPNQSYGTKAHGFIRIEGSSAGTDRTFRDRARTMRWVPLATARRRRAEIALIPQQVMGLWACWIDAVDRLPALGDLMLAEVSERLGFVEPSAIGCARGLLTSASPVRGAVAMTTSVTSPQRCTCE